jgi:hypothetical protein
MGDQDRAQSGRVQATVAHPAVYFAGGETSIDQNGGDAVGDINRIASAAAAENADG